MTKRYLNKDLDVICTDEPEGFFTVAYGGSDLPDENFAIGGAVGRLLTTIGSLKNDIADAPNRMQTDAINQAFAEFQREMLGVLKPAPAKKTTTRKKAGSKS